MKNRLAAETVIIAQLLRMLLTFCFHTATTIVRLDRSTCRFAFRAFRFGGLGLTKGQHFDHKFVTFLLTTNPRPTRRPVRFVEDDETGIVTPNRGAPAFRCGIGMTAPVSSRPYHPRSRRSAIL